MSDQQHSTPPDLRDRKNWSQFQTIFTKIIQQLHASGALTSNDLSSPEKLWAKLDHLGATGGLQIIGVIDHRDDLIDQADQFVEEGKHNLALMFYALFFEHTFNGVIDRQISRRGMGPRVAAEAIRGIGFEGKLGWFLEVLELPPLNPVHRKVISQVAQERNAFVHYKWNPMPDGREDRERANLKLKELVLAAKKATTYLKRYEARLLHEGTKGRIGKVTKLVKPK